MCVFLINIIFVLNVFAAEEPTQTVWEFPYSGSPQEWIAPTDGVYRFETWGASGGYRGGDNSGAGGYASGYVYLKKGDRFYVRVGGSGQTHKGWNGGGYRSTFNHYGGGATDIRFNTDSLYSRIIVAGGGGTDGADRICGGGGGGGNAGVSGGGTCGGCGSGGNGASITGAGSNGASFGQGGNGYSGSGGHAGAGGGGWYGGGGANPDGSADDDRGGGGGSSFIWNEGTTGNVPTGYTVPRRLLMYSFSYSGNARRGDGYAKITNVQPDGIAQIKLNNGNVNLNYNYKQKSYTITVSNDVPSVMFNVTPKENYSISYSQKNLDLSSTTGTELITVTHIPTGISEVFTIKVNQVNYYLKGSGSNVYYDIPYTGEYQEFYVPSTGTWTIETWGAQGAGRSAAGGRGGYTVADVDLSKGEKLYLWVGGAGSTRNIDGRTKGFNGGGHSYYYFSYGGFYQSPTDVYGGGATDVRIGGNTAYHRLIVASGGGGSGRNAAGGAGGLSSNGGCGSGGTAAGNTGGGSYNGTWCTGGSEIYASGGYGGPGGGGWYGGGARHPDGSGDDDGGGGGGSGFIWRASSKSYVPEAYEVSDKFYMTNGFIHHGGESFKSPSGGNETGHGGNGYIRLTPKLLNGVDAISINGGSIPIDFDYTKYDYIITVPDEIKYINVNAIIADGFSYAENHSGNYDISEANLKEYIYTLTVVNDITGLSRVYTIKFRKSSYYWQEGSAGSYGYTCTKDVQEFKAPASGIYTVEAWGAQGQSTGQTGGAGSYVKANMFLSKGEIVYVYVGCSGANGGYNGGGEPYSYRDGNQNVVIPWAVRGGGASDIRLGGKTTYHRVLVAGGGGGAGASGTGGPGDAEGNNGGCGSQGSRGTMSGGGWADGMWAKGATQYYANGGYAGAGGGGWYGGGAGRPDSSGNDDKGGGGGSSYVWSSQYADYAPADYEVSRSRFLTNPEIRNGYSSMPTHNGKGTMTGNYGDGYVRFDFALSYKYKIKVSDNVTLDKAFDYDTKNYVGTVANTSSVVDFDVDLTGDESVLTHQNSGRHEIHVGENNYPISITYVNGAVDIFNYRIDREANDIDILNDLKINGESLSNFSSVDFSPNRYDYNITLPYSYDEYDLNIDKGSADQVFDIYTSVDTNRKFEVVDSVAHITEKNNTYDLVVNVENETHTSSKTYTLHVTLPHSSKLKKLNLISGSNQTFEYLMEEDKEVYNIELESYVASVTAVPEVFDAEATYEVIGDGYISSDVYTILVNVTEPHSSPTTYIFNIKRISIGGYEKNVGYTGTCTTFIVPYSHDYQLETWGAQGGRGGGRGGYSVGTVYLNKGDVLYLCAGGSGDNGGFNGGGTSRAGYGGGASDVRIGTNSVYARILIAGGGGGHGSDGCAFGGVGGGLNGGGKNGQGSCGTNAGGGTQTQGGTYGVTGGARGNIGKFAVGAVGPNSGGGYYGGGGGGGFYGGGSGATAGWSSGGGGGSGFIYDEDSYTMVTDLLSETFGGGKWLVSEDYLLKNAQSLNGSESFPNTAHTGNETGHAGNGYIKVSIPYQKSENNFLAGIISNRGTIRQEWDYNRFEYDLDLDTVDTEINIEGVPADDKASVAGNGDYIIEAGDHDIILTVTSESGLVKTYTVHVHRETDHNPYPKKIAVEGMLAIYCNLHEGMCEYTYNKDIDEYEITVPYQIREINITVDKAHYFQEVVGDGIYRLDGGPNELEVYIKAEDKMNETKYYYNIIRDMTGNNDLASLRVTNPETTLNYSYNVTDYYITVDNETDHIDIEALPDDIRASVDVQNIETLEYGSDNHIPIVVTAENGAVKTYTIHVTRLRSNNAFLKTLKVYDVTTETEKEVDLKPTFSKGVTEYNVYVDNDITKVRIDAEVEKEEFATLVGDGEKNLNVGRNSYSVVVTAQDESNLPYNINIYRAANSNALLNDLKVLDVEDNVVDFSEPFESDKFVYYIYAPATLEQIKINATPQESTTRYQVVSGDINHLVSGRNTIVVRAIAEDDSYNDYTIIIIRTPYNDSDLVSLTVSNGSENYILEPEFSPVIDEYTLNVPNEIENLKITAIANKNERAQIFGNYLYTENVNVLRDNPFERIITVTAESGETHSYKITITRDKSSDNSLKSLSVDNHVLDPVFDSETLEYSFSTFAHSININAVPNNKYARVNISKTNLDEGLNEIIITVTSETGVPREYKLNVTRILSTDASLASLNVSTGYTPEFNPETFVYNSTTHNSSATITATLSNEWATYKVVDELDNDYTNIPVVLNVGTNKFRVITTAENGDHLTYEVEIERILNKNPNLSGITISSGSIEFDKDTTEYTINTQAHSFDISATMEDSEYAIYEILDEDSNVIDGHIDFEKGQSVTRTITIRGYAEDRSITKDYVLTINRTPKNEAKIKSFGFTTTPAISDDNRIYTSTVDETKLDLSNLVLYDDWATYEVEGNENFLVSGQTYPVTITVTAEDGEAEEEYQFEVLKVISTNPKIKKIEISGAPLTPEFNMDTTSYKVYLDNDVSEIDLNAITLKDTARITSIKVNDDEIIDEPIREFNNTISIPSYVEDEPRTITITSLAEDGETEITYTINIKSTDDINNYLASLQFVYKNGEDDVEGNLSPEFNKEVTDYSIELPEGTTHITVSGLPEAPSSTVTGNESYTLGIGQNSKELKITVTSKENQTRDYYIHVTRKLSTESRIKSVSFKNDEIEFSGFDKDIYEYDVNVPNNVKTLTLADINYEMVDETATIMMSSCKLSSKDLNECTLYGIAESGARSVYKLNITREKGTEARLKTLSFGQYKFDEGDFDPDIKSYTLRVPKTKPTLGRSDLSYTLIDEDATVSFPPTINLDFNSNDNNYVITTTASDGETHETYIINVSHILSNDNTIQSYTLNNELITVTAEQNAQSAPVLEYGIFDDESSATLTEIMLNNEDGSHSATFPRTITVGKDYLVAVTSESGIVKNYTFRVVRNKTRNLALASLNVSLANSFDCSGICKLDHNYDPNNEEDTEFTYTVPYGVNSVDIALTLKSQFQSYEIIGNDGFVTGENEVIIRVYNSLDEHRDYKITVIREPSHDANLRNIGFSTPEQELEDYVEDIYEYNTEFSALDSGRYVLNIDKKDPGQTYSVTGAQVLYFGMNDIYVNTSSESCFSDTKSRYGCEQQRYLIHAYRYETWSNLLNSLTISSGNSGNLLQDFVKYKFDYVLQVPSEVSKIKVESIAAASDKDGVYHADIDGNGEYNLNIGLNTIEVTVTPEGGGRSQTYTINVIRSASDNVNLENLEVIGQTMTPSFAKNLVDYYVNVPAEVNSLNLRYTKESEESEVYVTGNSNLVTGENIVSIVVISADKTRGKTYKIHVNKSASNNNLLSSLVATSIVGDETITHTLEPTFKNDINDYVINVSKYTDNIRFDVETEHPLARVEGAGSRALEYGENQFVIAVTSESGVVNNYNITVNREYNLNMAELSVHTLDIEPVEYLTNFNKNVKEYTVNVPFEVSEVDVDGLLEEEGNTVEGLGIYELHTGVNDVEVTVSAGEDITDTYILHINRAKNNDSKLLYLSVEEGVMLPEFTSDNTAYSVEIPFEYDSITPTYELSDKETGRVEILNNENIEVNVPQDVTVRVFAEDNTYTDYVITVTRSTKSKSSNYLQDMYLEDLPFDRPFTRENLNYIVDVEKAQTRVTLHVLPESTYSKLEVYRSDQSDIVRKLDARSPDPNVTLNLQVGRNTFIVRVTNEEGLIRNYKVDIFRAGTAEARIKSLEFDHGVMSPSFDKNNTNYTISLDNQYKRIDIKNIVMVDANATYVITGNKKLSTGENIVTILTTAQDGRTQMTYTFVVNRKLSDNAYLQMIATFPEFDDDVWEFDKEKYQYTLEIEPDVTQVQVIGVREDTSASITGNGIYKITQDNTKIDLVVTSESGNFTRTYTVNIIRKKDNNNYLKSLTTNNGVLVPDFDKTVQDYTIEVENSVSLITLNGIAEASKAVVSGNVKNAALVEGENKFAITVTAEDGTTRTYNIIVNRKENEANKLQLDYLNVKEGELTPAFSPLTENYIVNVPNDYESATIQFRPHDPDALVSINWNKVTGEEYEVPIEVGHNKVEIRVSVGDDTKLYTIDIVKQEMSNTYLKDLAVIGYTVSPEFDKTILEYSVTVPNNVTKVNLKALKEAESSHVYIRENDGDYRESTGYDNNINLSNGVNNIYYKVVSITNAERVYKLKITREASDDNKLLTFTPTVGTLTEPFDPNVNKYTINVPTGTTAIKFNGTYSQGASQVGLNSNYTVAVGTTTKFVTITSQSGIVNTYEFRIVREPSHNANITNIVPSTGKLSPTFNSSVTEYNMTVEGDVVSLNFNVTTEDSNATITGHRLNTLSDGMNTIKIVVTAEDGVTKSEVIIKVYRKIDIKNLVVDDPIDVPIGDTYNLLVEYVPENTDYKDLDYSVKDTSVLTIDANGVITPKIIGSTKVTVTSQRHPTLTKTITVNVIQPKILSDVYYIDRDIEYISGFEPADTIEEFVGNLKNDKEWIHVYTANGDELGDEDGVATKYVVKLEINNKTYDQLTLVLKGDIDGNGKIAVADINRIRNSLLKKLTLDPIEEAAADIDCNTKVAVADINKVRNYLLKKITTMNDAVLELKANEE